MSKDYEKWEVNNQRIRKDNEALLVAFKTWLAAKGLGKKTINSHYQNVDFYINDYLLYTDEVFEAREGALEIGGFLGDWFVRKAAWSSKAHIKGNVASLKKFYTFLYERGDIDKTTLKEFKALIKEEMPYWLENMEDYDSDLGSYW